MNESVNILIDIKYAVYHLKYSIYSTIITLKKLLMIQFKPTFVHPVINYRN